jgi:hypothetical protein
MVLFTWPIVVQRSAGGIVSKPDGITPITVYGTSSSEILRPMMRVFSAELSSPETGTQNGYIGAAGTVLFGKKITTQGWTYTEDVKVLLRDAQAA